MRLEKKLKLGYEVSGQVLEILDTRELILRIFVDAQPELIRVANESRRALRRGDRVRLRVTALAPVQFQYLDDLRELKAHGHIDVSI